MNIILISLDTTRADRLSCYGYSRPTSPNLDQVANQGALFTEMFSPHIPTFPGHTTMLTGRDLFAHQVTGQSHAHEPAEGVPMLAEILKSRGYYTAAADNLGRWFARGFDQYETYSWDMPSQQAWRKAEAVNEAALKVVDAAAGQDKPFFLFLHYWDPHTPYLPPAPYSRMFYGGDEKDPANRSMDPVWSFETFRWYFNEWMPGVTDIEFPKAQYDAEIAYMDSCLAHLFARLEHHDLVEDTLLVITADHGEELDEHGCWFDHHGLYEPNIRVPLILRLPGKIPSGSRIPGFVRTHDIVPTALDYAGLLDPALKFEGMSLRPLIEEPHAQDVSAGTCDELFLTENTWMKKRAIRTHRWKLIVSLEPDIHDLPMTELFHLTTDSGETRNLADEMPDVVAELRTRLDAHVASRVAATGLPDPLPLQPIPLRKIGNMAAAVPKDAVKTPDAEPVDAPSDEKIEHGDFVGYEREDG